MTSHNASTTSFGIFLFLLIFFAGHTVLSINNSSAVGMFAIDGGGGLPALRMIDITVERRYVSNDPRSAL